MKRQIFFAFLLWTGLASGQNLSFDKPTEKTLFNSQLIFSAQSQVEVLPHSLKILQGHVWVVKARKLRIETVYGQLAMDGSHGFVKMDLSKDQMMVRLGPMKAFVKNRLGELLPLNQGEEMWLGSLDRDGRQTRGVPAPVVWSWFAQEWGKDFPYKEKILNASKDIKKITAERVEQSAQISQEVINRDVASQKQQEEEALKARQAKEVQLQQRRKQFFDRVFYR